MSTLFDEAAVVENANAVGLLDRGQAVCNDETGPIRTEILERLLDEALGGIVEGRGGFIEQQERGIFQKCAGDGQPLFFPAGEAAATLAGDGGEAVRTGADKGGSICSFKCGPDLVIGGVLIGKEEVFPQGGVEEETFLRYVAELIAQPFFGQRI